MVLAYAACQYLRRTLHRAAPGVSWRSAQPQQQNNKVDNLTAALTLRPNPNTKYSCQTSMTCMTCVACMQGMVQPCCKMYQPSTEWTVQLLQKTRGLLGLENSSSAHIAKIERRQATPGQWCIVWAKRFAILEKS